MSEDAASRSRDSSGDRALRQNREGHLASGTNVPSTRLPSTWPLRADEVCAFDEVSDPKGSVFAASNLFSAAVPCMVSRDLFSPGIFSIGNVVLDRDYECIWNRRAGYIHDSARDRLVKSAHVKSHFAVRAGFELDRF